MFHRIIFYLENSGAALAKAEEAVAQCTDKKLIKDLEAKLAALKEALTLDFERILIEKTDTRSFTIKNTCLLPVAWEIDLGDFKDSPNVSVEPMKGILPINTTLPIVVSFSSADPLMLTGKFNLRYSDHEVRITVITYFYITLNNSRNSSQGWFGVP